jgi:hypothetical protein
MKHLAILAIVTCLYGCALPGTGWAGSVVYSTFGEPGDTFNTGAGVAVAGSGSVFGYAAQASAFTPSASVTLDSFRFAAFTGATGYQVDAIIATNSNGAPGAALETFSSITLPKSALGTILTENSVTHPGLVAGTTYWLVLRPTDPTSSEFGTWDQSLPVVKGAVGTRFATDGAWQIGNGGQAAFDIEGTAVAVPEPGSLTLLGVTAAGLLGFGWRNRKQAT